MDRLSREPLTSAVGQSAARPLSSRLAHVLERSGLAMLGASGGLFVAARLAKTDVEVLTFPIIVLLLMAYGALGAYLGIDMPPQQCEASRADDDRAIARSRWIERLSSGGTFLGALAAFVSIYSIVVDENPHDAWTLSIGLAWLLGVSMQIVAGVVARSGTASALQSPTQGPMAPPCAGLVGSKPASLRG
uniref:Uncharacterized protein n=1 Tax=Rhodopseudomonas palustris (strain BisA53) TaxID=316055 RepID=Q07GW1_RHOP5